VLIHAGMSTPRLVTVVAAAGLLAGAASCKGKSSQEASPPPAVATPASPPAATAIDPAAASALFGALPGRFDSAANPATPEKIALGRMLYYDPRLSKNHDVSCNTCHDLSNAGVDHDTVSTGHRGQRGNRNAPTVYNAAGQLAQFWDGRAADVEEQARGPVLNPVEMAMPDPDAVVRVLRSMPAYVAAFKAAFPGEKDPVNYQNFGLAVGAFERGLVTPSRFDAYLAGDRSALSDTEQRGLATFVSTGCTACHNGVLVGGGSYQKLGTVQPYSTADPGRMKVTHADADRQVFKVPPLRNVARTGPYFHDGAIADLATAVRTMARVQLGRTLGDPEVASIVAFLGALDGRPPPDYVAPPRLPPSSPTTPPPDAT